MAKLKIAVAGSGGRMGRALLEAVLGGDDVQLGCGARSRGQSLLGKDAGELVGCPGGVAISDDVENSLAGCDVLIDFTRPEGTLAHLQRAASSASSMVIGTTGFDAAQKNAIAEAARDIAIVMAPNMSVGVNVVLKLLDIAARGARPTATTSRSSRPTTATKSTRRRGTALHMGEVIAAGAGPRPRRMRGLRPRRRHRRARPVDHRLCHACAAATSSATTRCCSPAPASASRSHTFHQPRHLRARAPARGALPRGQSDRACSTCTTCSAC